MGRLTANAKDFTPLLRSKKSYAISLLRYYRTVAVMQMTTIILQAARI